jgi:transcriptional regulator with XRE-family HTH domain
MKKFARSSINEDILSLIRTYAYNNNLSMSEVGRRAGISKAWLSKLKNSDANLSLETAERILNTLGYSFKIEKR